MKEKEARQASGSEDMLKTATEATSRMTLLSSLNRLRKVNSQVYTGKDGNIWRQISRNSSPLIPSSRA